MRQYREMSMHFTTHHADNVLPHVRPEEHIMSASVEAKESAKGGNAEIPKTGAPRKYRTRFDGTNANDSC